MHSALGLVCLSSIRNSPQSELRILRGELRRFLVDRCRHSSPHALYARQVMAGQAKSLLGNPPPTSLQNSKSKVQNNIACVFRGA